LTSSFIQVWRQLFEAVKNGNVKTTKIFLRYTDDSCLSDGWVCDKPLKYAASGGRVELVRVLLEEGANVYNTDVLMCTALHNVAFYVPLDG
jgi:citrate lyase alpha subunit